MFLVSQSSVLAKAVQCSDRLQSMSGTSCTQLKWGGIVNGKVGNQNFYAHRKANDCTQGYGYNVIGI